MPLDLCQRSHKRLSITGTSTACRVLGRSREPGDKWHGVNYAQSFTAALLVWASLVLVHEKGIRSRKKSNQHVRFICAAENCFTAYLPAERPSQLPIRTAPRSPLLSLVGRWVQYVACTAQVDPDVRRPHQNGLLGVWTWSMDVPESHEPQMCMQAMVLLQNLWHSHPVSPAPALLTP